MPFTPFTTAAGVPSFASHTYEPQGVGTTGSDTQLTGGAGTNSLGAWTAIGGAIAADWSEFTATFTATSTASNRILADFSLDGGVTTLIANVYLATNSQYQPTTINFPIAVPAGTTISARVRNSTGSSTIRCGISGQVKDASNDAPGLTASDTAGITAVDTANTRPSSGTVTIGNTGAYTQIIAATAHAYKAIQFILGEGTVAATGNVAIVIGVDPAGGSSYTDTFWFNIRESNASPAIVSAISRLFKKAISAGSSVAIKASHATSTDTLRAQFIGYY